MLVVVTVTQLTDDAGTCELLERLAGELGLVIARNRKGRTKLLGPDGRPVRPWLERYPYDEGGSDRAAYEEVKQRLQIELLKLQRSVKASGQRLLILFEGRDAAGKGGTIKRFNENLNPRGARVVALEKPEPHEVGELYLRRYLPHLPGPGEIAMFDRSWYNRAGVEIVMGFCPREEYQRFLSDAPEFERSLVAEGVTVVKFWFSVTRAEQLRRFLDRQVDPVKKWKLSAVDLASLDKWDDYTRAKQAVFAHTDLPEAPWTVVKSNDKRRARVEAMRHVLSLFEYEDKDHLVVGQPDPLIAGPARLLSDSDGGPAPARRIRPAPGRHGWPGPDGGAAGRPGTGRTGTGRTGAGDGGRRLAAGRPGPVGRDLIERDAGRDRRVQRFGTADRDLDEEIALPRDEPGQSLPLRADHEHQRAVGQGQAGQTRCPRWRPGRPRTGRRRRTPPARG